MTTEFKVGDIVQLKSGSPEMTVTQVSEFGGNTRIGTAWFAGKKAEKDIFPEEALEHAEDDDE